MEKISHGSIDFGGAQEPNLLFQDSVLVHHIGDKCPQNCFDQQYGPGTYVKPNLLALSDSAKKAGIFSLSYDLRYCCTDAIIFRNPDGELSFTPVFCMNRLCPVCHKIKAQLIRKRLRKVVKRSKTMVTLTLRTHHDYDLKKNIDILRRSLRMLFQRKRKKQWCPFEGGYFWRLEVTPGQGYHPHLHVLSVKEFIPYDKLKARWAQCIRHNGGDGHYIYISETNKKSIYEACKYLSKDLSFFSEHRWRHLYDGLKGIRTFGSGGALRLPKLWPKGNQLITFASKIGYHSFEEYKDYLYDSPLAGALQEHSILKQKISTIEEWSKHYGDCYESSDEW